MISQPSRARSIAIYLAAGVLALALLAYGARLVQQVRDATMAWRAHVSQATELEAALHEVVHNLGYGGFIHHFKNYVLRYDSGLLLALEDDLARVRDALDRFQALGLAGDERQALNQLRQAVDEYAGKVELAKVLVDEGRSPQEIDRRVRVDDAPALAAIASLEEHAEQVLTRSRDQIEAALLEVVRQLMLGALLLLPIALVAVVLARDRRAMRLANERLLQAKGYADDLVEGMPDALLVIGEGGRIRQANLAAEKLLGYRRERLLEMTVEQLMPPRYREGHVGLRERARAQRQTRPFGPESKLLALRGDGREVPVEISISHSRQDDALLSLVSLRDVTERERLSSLLEERQESLEKAQAIAHIGSWDWRIMSDEIDWSDETFRIFGHAPRAFPPSYEAFVEHVHPGDRARVREAVSATLEHDLPYDVEHRIVRPDGSERVVQQRAEVFRAAGRPVRMIGTILDITERKAAERELRFDKAIIQGLSQPVVVADDQVRIVDLNDAYCRMSGYSREEVMGQSPGILKSGRHDAEFYRGMWDSINVAHSWRGEIWNRMKDGSVQPQLLSITRICEPEADSCRYVGFYSDITSLKENEARLEKLAHFDPLTGLANRMLCLDRLRAAIARAHRSGKQVAVLFVDLDGFKQVNDRLGHQTGDMLLVEVAERMKQGVREDDTVARLGGDEFAVILNDIDDRDEVRHLAERMLAATRVTMGAGDVALAVTGSIGIGCYPQDGETEDQLLKAADQAMYLAKQAGKAQLAFHRAD